MDKTFAFDNANEERAWCAEQGLDRFREALEETGRGGSDEQMGLADLLADLHHFADREGLDWERAFRLAIHNYHAETSPKNPAYGGSMTDEERAAEVKERANDEKADRTLRERIDEGRDPLTGRERR